MSKNFPGSLGRVFLCFRCVYVYAELHMCILVTFQPFKRWSQAQVASRNIWTVSHTSVPELNVRCTSVSLFLCVTPLEQRLCGLEEQHSKATLTLTGSTGQDKKEKNIYRTSDDSPFP